MATLKEAIEPTFRTMSLEERGLLHLLLVHGKALEGELKKIGVSLDDSGILTEYGKNETPGKVVAMLESSFESGAGLIDALAGRYDDYGAQLQYVIDKVLVRSFGTVAPVFDLESSTLEGALQRERWICERSLQALWDKLPEDAKKQMAGKVEELLKRSGIDPSVATRVSAGLLTGGFSLVRMILGFRFHIFLAQYANAFAALTFSANAGLQRLAGAFLGPIGILLSSLLLLPTLIGILFPRELDKFVPAIFVIGLHRLQQASEPNAA